MEQKVCNFLYFFIFVMERISFYFSLVLCSRQNVKCINLHFLDFWLFQQKYGLTIQLAGLFEVRQFFMSLFATIEVSMEKNLKSTDLQNKSSLKTLQMTITFEIQKTIFHFLLNNGNTSYNKWPLIHHSLIFLQIWKSSSAKQNKNI